MSPRHVIVSRRRLLMALSLHRPNRGIVVGIGGMQRYREFAVAMLSDYAMIDTHADAVRLIESTGTWKPMSATSAVGAWISTCPNGCKTPWIDGADSAA